MLLVLSKKGITANGESWSWEYGKGLKCRGILFTLHEAIATRGIESAGWECLEAEEAATTAFEWQAYAKGRTAVKKALRKILRAKRPGDAARVILTAFIQGIQNAIREMFDCTDEEFSKYLTSPKIQSKASQLMLKFTPDLSAGA